MSRWSTSLIIREVHIKTTIRYHFTPSRMGLIKKTEKNKFLWEVRMLRSKNYHMLLVRILKWHRYFKKQLSVPQNVKHRIIIWPSNSTMGIHQGEVKTHVHTENCTWMLIVVLVKIAKGTNQMSNRWMDRQIMACVHTIE